MLGIYFKSGTVLGAKNIAVSKNRSHHHGGHVPVGRQTGSKQTLSM